MMLSKLFGLRAIRTLLIATGLLMALVLPGLPAQASPGAQVPVNLTVRDQSYNANLGKVSGYIQFDTGNLSYTYNLTVCRQSAYPVPYVTLGANGITSVTTLYPTINSYTADCPQGQGTLTGTVSWQYRLLQAPVSITGGTFHGSQYLQFTKSGTAYNPNPA